MRADFGEGCSRGFLEKSSSAFTFDVSAGGSCRGHGKGNRVLRARQVSREATLESSGATRQGDLSFHRSKANARCLRLRRRRRWLRSRASFSIFLNNQPII